MARWQPWVRWTMQPGAKQAGLGSSGRLVGLGVLPGMRWRRAGVHAIAPATLRCLPALPCRQKRRRIASQFEDLQECYRLLRAGATGMPAAQLGAAELLSGGAASGGAGEGSATREGAVVAGGLAEFGRVLSVLARCNTLKVNRPGQVGRGCGSTRTFASACAYGMLCLMVCAATPAIRIARGTVQFRRRATAPSNPAGRPDAGGGGDPKALLARRVQQQHHLLAGV